jgi:6-phosphogluconolactonase
MGPSAPEVVVHPGPEELAAAVAEQLVAVLAAVQGARGSAAVVLTGGRVGARVLELFAAAGSRPGSPLAWDALDVWWGDERFLPAGHPDRNEVQARAALLDAVPLDPARVHPMPASDGPDGDDPDAAARRYAAELAAAARASGVPGALPVLDVLLLGVGPDGHVASLFPGDDRSPAGDPAVVAVRDAPKPPPTRLSLTLPAITGADQVWCVVSGEDKAAAVTEALSTDGRLRGRLPAARVTGTGRTLWLLDRPAAAGLPAG